MDKKNIISKFINDIISEYGIVPKFAYNNKEFENKVLYSGPFFDENEIEAIIETLIFGKWFSSGEKVHKFENEFSKKFNSKYSVMVNSGSSANLIMLAALKKYFNWDDNSEIIISVVGFPTTLSAILLNNLKPSFVDIELQTLNFDLHKLKQNINSNTKAIFISPVLGNPPNIDELINISKTYNLKLILDNCDSLGTKWFNKYLNEYCITSSCSFYSAHQISTGEGGMISSDIKEIIDIARSMISWGRDCYCVGSSNLLPQGTCKKRFSDWLKPLYNGIVDHKYVFTNIGYNLKPLDIQGAMGLVQLDKFGKIKQNRIYNKSHIEKYFLKINGIKKVEKHSFSDVCWFGVPILCKTKELKTKLVEHLEQNNIQTRNYFAGNILLHPAYKNYDDFSKYPMANEVLDKVFFVGCSPHYTEQTLKYIKLIVENFKE